MNYHINLNAYDKYEIFTDHELEIKYRNSKINSALSHVKFIKNFFTNKISVLELGSGNSKTLYALEQNNLLKKGYGIEISKSRHDFAERWRRDCNFKNVVNINESFTQFDLNNIEDIDLCFCVDLAFQFIDPVSEKYDKILLKNIYNKLNDKGKIILELDGCDRAIDKNSDIKKVWEEFNEPDPWQYSLWNCIYDKHKSFLRWSKTFISRDKLKEDKTEIILRLYSSEEIYRILFFTGFQNINLYQDWNFNEFKTDKENFIIIAEK